MHPITGSENRLGAFEMDKFVFEKQDHPAMQQKIIGAQRWK